MENQHRKITGYRELDQTEIDLMNEIKALGPLVEGVLLKVDAHIAGLNEKSKSDTLLQQRLHQSTAHRFLAMAKTEMQTGLMHATRAAATSTAASTGREHLNPCTNFVLGGYMIDVTNKLKTYDNETGSESSVQVTNHWNDRKMIKLRVDAAGEALQVTVLAADLEAAIKNATNVNRY
jgi:hypothetical protein